MPVLMRRLHAANIPAIGIGNSPMMNPHHSP